MKTSTILAMLAASVASGTTLAQASEEGTPSVVHTAGPTSFQAAPVIPGGMSLQAGGGVTAFSKQSTRDTFGVGGYWDMRAVLGTHSILGAEVAYVGSARDIKAGGVSNSAALLGDGAEAVVRANLPLDLREVQLTPYAFGGAGWTYYQIANNSGANSSGIKDHANAFDIPFGGGASATYERFVADARFTYRATWDQKLVPTGGNTHLDLQNWSVGATLGYQF